MKGIWLLAALAAGIYFAARLTRWVNWYTFGENSMKRKTGGKDPRKISAGDQNDS